jgi:hypothetical protein
MLLRLLSLLFSVALASHLSAQNPLHFKRTFNTGIIVPHSSDVENTRGAMPYGIELGVGRTDTSLLLHETCNCFTQQGIDASYFDYGSNILGFGIAATYYFEPLFRLTNKTLLGVRAKIGPVFQSNPYHAIRNPANMSYSMPFSFFLGLSPGVQVKVSRRFALGGYAGFFHTSNGGLKDPNKGINWFNFSAGVTYHTQSFEYPKHRTEQKKDLEKDQLYVHGFYSSKLLSIGDKKRYSVYGFGLDYLKPISRLSAWQSGFELHNDESLNQRLLNDSLVEISSIRSGILTGHTFLLGRIHFSQQIGYYLYSPSPYFSKFYHRWGLNYRHPKGWSAGISLKAHAHVANFADVRLAYRIK